jgi:hypothetical protein
MLPPPDISAAYVDVQTGRPTRDFFNWIKSLAGVISPNWLENNPVAGLAPTGGALTSSGSFIRFNRVGNIVQMFGEITIINVGTATGDLTFTLPVAARNSGPAGAAWNRSTGNPLSGFWLSNPTTAVLDFGATAIANNTYNFSITYEAG